MRKMEKKKSLPYLLTMIILSILVVIGFTNCSDIIETPEENNNIFFNKTEQQIVSSSSKFGFALLKEISKSKEGENIFISPLSASMAFGMVLNGTNSTTYDEIKSVLGLDALSQDEINKSFKSVIETLSNIDGKVQFQSANSIWYRAGFNVEQNFLEINKKYFNALVQSADFNNPLTVNLINDWVKQNTNSKIDKIINKISPEMVMYLINAIYFKGTWKYQFDKTKTADFPFKVQGIGGTLRKMMMQEADLNYYAGSNYVAVDLPYGNNSYRMRIILPNSNSDAAAVLQNLNPEEFNRINGNMTKHTCILRMPLFKLSFEMMLNDVLKSLGMKKAFDSQQANFTGINKSEKLFISEVKQKTFVDVNEEGTEAAAVTSIGIKNTSMGGNDNKIYIDVDRPFLFMIYECNSSTILFMGAISNPTIE
jgi:serine protease inhibitor